MKKTEIKELGYPPEGEIPSWQILDAQPVSPKSPLALADTVKIEPETLKRMFITKVIGG